MRKITISLLLVFLLLMFTMLQAQDIPRTLYVLNGLGRTVSKMNLETNEITNDFLTVGDVPNQILTRDDKIYVVNSTPPGISIIDARSEQVTQIALAEGSNPYAMAFIGTHKAYITNLMANSVSVVDLESGTVLKDISVGTGPEGILVVGNTAYVANSGGWPDYAGASVSIINIQTDMVTKTLAVTANPQNLALSPDGNVHVVCTGNYGDISGRVCVINPYGAADWTPAVTDTIEIGGSPGAIAITKNGTAYLAAFGDGSNGFIYAYDVYTSTVSHDASNPITVGNGAMNLFYEPVVGQLWVNNFSDDAVQLLNPENASVVQTYAFGDGAQDMAILGPIFELDAWADGVVSFTPGTGAGFGQNFFPDNVLGPPDPDPTLSVYNSSCKPQEILSLGHGGEIILEFSDNYIIDGNGVDFTVFENVFLTWGTDEPFIEAAIVSVSMNGVDWVTFPYDTSTWAGFAGVTPTMDNQHPTNPNVSGGDSFDLTDVGLPYACFVKLTDIGDLKQEGAWNGDFDLDAVVAVNSQQGQPSAVKEQVVSIPENFQLFQNYPNPFNPETVIKFSTDEVGQIELKVFNTLGQEIKTLINEVKNKGTYQVVWNGKDNAGKFVVSGLYFYQLKSGAKIQIRKMTLLQ